MLRKFVCAAVVLVLVAGVSLAEKEKAKKGKHVHGTFISYEGGTLIISVKKKGEEEATEKKFKVPEETKIIVFDKDEKTELTGKDVEKIKEATKKGTRILVMLNDDDEVTGVRINPPKRKPKKEE